MRFPNSLYWKISAGFLFLLISLGVVLTLVSVNSALNFARETDQQLNRTLAQDLSKKLKPFLEDSLDIAGIEHSFHDLMVMNPRVELYLLDERGGIMAFFAEPEKVKRTHVDLKPVDTFLTGDVSLPILGDDPRNSSRQKPFSVARIKMGRNIDGFLYVILGGEQFDSAGEMIQGSYILRTTTMSLAVAFLSTGIVGLIIFAYLTRRFHAMTGTVRNFERGDFNMRIPVHSRDEVGQLASAFNQMADTIVANMEELKHTDQLRRDILKVCGSNGQ